MRPPADPAASVVAPTADVAYDGIVVGGGPAGLSAALQLTRGNRQVLVIDSGMGRSTYHQVNENYLGFPGGVRARQLRDLGREQVRRYPVAFTDSGAVAATRAGDCFLVSTEAGERFRARVLIFATGVRDHFPTFPDWESYVGRSIFWCIVCDGYSTRGKRLIVVGNDEESGVTALQFLQFTNRVTLLTNAPSSGLSRATVSSLKRHGVEFVEGELAGVHGHDGILAAVDLRDRRRLEADFLFSLQGSTPNSDLAATLGVSRSTTGYIVVDDDQQTSVPGVFAAGDVTRHFSHQIATAVHEGLTAAASAQHYLYEPWQRHSR